MAAFLLYATLVIVAVVIIIVQYAPKYGQTHIITYVGVCSLVGSIGVGTHLSGWSLAFHFSLPHLGSLFPFLKLVIIASPLHLYYLIVFFWKNHK